MDISLLSTTSETPFFVANYEDLSLSVLGPDVLQSSEVDLLANFGKKESYSSSLFSSSSEYKSPAPVYSTSHLKSFAASVNKNEDNIRRIPLSDLTPKMASVRSPFLGKHVLNSPFRTTTAPVKISNNSLQSPSRMQEKSLSISDDLHSPAVRVHDTNIHWNQQFSQLQKEVDLLAREDSDDSYMKYSGTYAASMDKQKHLIIALNEQNVQLKSELVLQTQKMEDMKKIHLELAEADMKDAERIINELLTMRENDRIEFNNIISFELEALVDKNRTLGAQIDSIHHHHVNFHCQLVGERARIGDIDQNLENMLTQTQYNSQALINMNSEFINYKCEYEALFNIYEKNLVQLDNQKSELDEIRTSYDTQLSTMQHLRHAFQSQCEEITALSSGIDISRKEAFEISQDFSKACVDLEMLTQQNKIISADVSYWQLRSRKLEGEVTNNICIVDGLEKQMSVLSNRCSDIDKISSNLTQSLRSLYDDADSLRQSCLFLSEWKVNIERICSKNESSVRHCFEENASNSKFINGALEMLRHHVPFASSRSFESNGEELRYLVAQLCHEFKEKSDTECKTIPVSKYKESCESFDKQILCLQYLIDELVAIVHDGLNNAEYGNIWYDIDHVRTMAHSGTLDINTIRSHADNWRRVYLNLQQSRAVFSLDTSYEQFKADVGQQTDLCGADVDNREQLLTAKIESLETERRSLVLQNFQEKIACETLLSEYTISGIARVCENMRDTSCQTDTAPIANASQSLFSLSTILPNLSQSVFSGNADYIPTTIANSSNHNHNTNTNFILDEDMISLDDKIIELKNLMTPFNNDLNSNENRVEELCRSDMLHNIIINTKQLLDNVLKSKSTVATQESNKEERSDLLAAIKSTSMEIKSVKQSFAEFQQASRESETVNVTRNATLSQLLKQIMNEAGIDVTFGLDFDIIANCAYKTIDRIRRLVAVEQRAVAAGLVSRKTSTYSHERSVGLPRGAVLHEHDVMNLLKQTSEILGHRSNDAVRKV